MCVVTDQDCRISSGGSRGLDVDCWVLGGRRVNLYLSSTTVTNLDSPGSSNHVCLDVNLTGSSKDVLARANRNTNNSGDIRATTHADVSTAGVDGVVKCSIANDDSLVRARTGLGKSSWTHFIGRGTSGEHDVSTTGCRAVVSRRAKAHVVIWHCPVGRHCTNKVHVVIDVDKAVGVVVSIGRRPDGDVTVVGIEARAGCTVV